MPISRTPRSDWLGSSASPPLIRRSNLSSGDMAAPAGAPATRAKEPALTRKSRRDALRMLLLPVALAISPCVRRLDRSDRATRYSPARRALRVDIERIDRMARGHEQPVALDAAEADVGRALRQCDEADGLAVRVEDFHPVLLRVTHAPAAPQIAVDVAAHAVGRASGLGGEEGAAVGELVLVDVVDADHARGHARLDDVE